MLSGIQKHTVYHFPFNNRKAAKNLLFIPLPDIRRPKSVQKRWTAKARFIRLQRSAEGSAAICGSMQSLQLQASTGVAYGIWIYEKVTKDRGVYRAIWSRDAG